MKRLTWLIMGLCSWACATGAPAQVNGRIVTIDLQQVFDKYYKTPQFRSKLEETRENFNKEHQARLDEYKKQVEDLNALKDEQDRPEYTPEVRDQKKKAMTDKLAEVTKSQRDIDDYRRSHQKLLEDQSLRMRQSILKDVTDVVNREAKDAGYLLVLDRSGNTLNGIPSVVYAQDSLDITAEIVKILNKNQPPAPEAPKAAEPKAEEKKPKAEEKK